MKKVEPVLKFKSDQNLTTAESEDLMKNLLAAIAKKMVDNPDQVHVTEHVGDSISVLELEVAKEDVGKILGVKGKNITAIRTIMSAAAAKEKKKIVIELIE